jgi:hypothetical protein
MTRSGNCKAAAARHRHCCLKRFETKPREAEEHEHEASNCERTDYRDGRVPTGN